MLKHYPGYYEKLSVTVGEKGFNENVPWILRSPPAVNHLEVGRDEGKVNPELNHNIYVHVCIRMCTILHIMKQVWTRTGFTVNVFVEAQHTVQTALLVVLLYPVQTV